MGQNRLILVVDDDHDTLSMVKTILTSNGFDVLDCGSGKEALEYLKTKTPALAVLDIMMPEMTGYQLLEKMREDEKTKDLPIIMLTAKAEPEDLIEGYKDYAVEYYITKPFTTRQLLAGVKLVLGHL